MSKAFQKAENFQNLTTERGSKKILGKSSQLGSVSEDSGI